MYTMNGEVLVDQPVCDSSDDHVLSCVFYEGVQSEWLERGLVLTGHSRGVVNIWSKNIRAGRFELELIRQLHHTDNTRDNGANISSGISCILALPQVVYTGDEAGRVVSLSCFGLPQIRLTGFPAVRVELHSAALRLANEIPGRMYRSFGCYYFHFLSDADEQKRIDSEALWGYFGITLAVCKCI